MGCTTCSGNPNTWCTQCMPAEDTWVAPVDKLPDVFMGDRDHMYLLPNGDLYILSPDRTRWIKVNGQGGGATYDDTKVINRLKALEGKTDNFISSVNVSRNGNKVKLTYTLVDGTIKEVEFEDKDTVALAYDDSALKARVKALEDKPVTPTGVNTFFAKGDISGNGNSQNVRITKDKLVNADTIKVGDTVVDSYWDKNNFNIGMFKVASVDGNTVTLNGVNDITYKHPKQTLTLSGRTLSISEGNSIELPASAEPKVYKAKGNGLFLDADGTFHLEMAKDTSRQIPYNTKNGGLFQKLTPANREVFKPSFSYDSLDNHFYFVANDGTVRRDAILEAGLLLDYAGSYDYEEYNLHKSFSSEGINLSVLSTSSQGISGSASFIQPQELKFEVGILAFWDSNGKVLFRFTPKIVWTIITESTTEHYTHFITKEELDSEEPIEIEVKKNEEVIGRLNMTIKNAKFYMQAVQGTVVLKNPTDNKFYYLPRLN
nr:MAG TPA: hypothetical protein [Caudoviricetes sp.]